MYYQLTNTYNRAKRGVGKINQIIFKPSKSKNKPSKILYK